MRERIDVIVEGAECSKGGVRFCILLLFPFLFPFARTTSGVETDGFGKVIGMALRRGGEGWIYLLLLEAVILPFGLLVVFPFRRDVYMTEEWQDEVLVLVSLVYV